VAMTSDGKIRWMGREEDRGSVQDDGLYDLRESERKRLVLVELK